MRNNKKPVIVSVVLCIAGMALQMTSGLNSLGQKSGGIMIFLGMILFAISLHDILKRKPDTNKNYE
jgi:hypothetical protein